MLIDDIRNKYKFDIFIGSLHHVYTMPIDFDRPTYSLARDKAGGSEQSLFEAYFDAQYEMLQYLKPPVVGHFDLIRLYSDQPDRNLQDWPGVWDKVIRNLEFTQGYGGLLELNSSGLRKGMSQPYPRSEICKVAPTQLFGVTTKRI